MRKFLFFFVIILLSAPVYSQQTKKQKDSAAKELSPIADKAIIYVLRPTSYGAAIKMKVFCNDTLIGSTKAGQYVYTIVNPGHYTLTSKAENKSSIILDVLANHIYYIKQKVLMGVLFAETDLIILEDEEGRKYLQKSKISKDNIITNQQ